MKTAAALLALLAAAPLLAEDASAPAEDASARLERIRRIASQGAAETPNADRSTVVAGEALPFADRSAILGLVDGLRTALERQLGAPGAPAGLAPAVSFRGPGFRVLVRGLADPEGTNAPASVRASLRPRRGGAAALLPAATIDLLNPANDLDAHEFAETVVDSFLRLKVLYAAPVRPAAPPRPPPRWLSAGLARLLDAAGRQADFDETRALWFRGALPPLPELAAEDAPFPSAEPAVAAQLAAFWLSFPDPAARFRDLCSLLASGVPWTPGLFLSTSLGTTDPLDGDRAFDAWLWGRDARVLSPGATTPELVARALVALQLFPGRDGVPADFADRPQPVERLLEPAAAAWAPAAADAVRLRILRLAVGRGDAFRAAAEELGGILADLARGGRRARRAAERLPAARDALARSADE